MRVEDLELIKTRNLFLKEGAPSGEIVLVDNIGGDMYFTFKLKYVGNSEKEGSTQFNVKDDFHAELVIDTKPFSFTKLKEPLYIGNYQGSKYLYLDFIVQPCASLGEPHNVIVSFYVNK
ncbi:MAG TPA: hypothetical protein H9824_05715 [Candidatus Bacteroides pullicola]|uniref:Uncharacterized protein n=1 Tax=Candidatus Bacteroides pullicola TaxID=2838475 RepID=A0A9D1ZGY0_9BACE|nr:hypothetical protein [Candidatus Bacteroides pullicola]